MTAWKWDGCAANPHVGCPIPHNHVLHWSLVLLFVVDVVLGYISFSSMMSLRIIDDIQIPLLENQIDFCCNVSSGVGLRELLTSQYEISSLPYWRYPMGSDWYERMLRGWFCPDICSERYILCFEEMFLNIFSKLHDSRLNHFGEEWPSGHLVRRLEIHNQASEGNVINSWKGSYALHYVTEYLLWMAYFHLITNNFFDWPWF